MMRRFCNFIAIQEFYQKVNLFNNTIKKKTKNLKRKKICQKIKKIGNKLLTCNLKQNIINKLLRIFRKKKKDN